MEVYRRARVPPGRVRAVSSVNALLDSVAAGLGVALLPRGAVRNAEVVFHRLAELPTIELVVAWRRDATGIARELVERAREK